MKHPTLYSTSLLLCLALCCAAQNAAGGAGDQPVIPADSKISLVLKQAISTRSAKVGDVVYAETEFPFVAEGHMLVPAGTFVLGTVTGVKRPGRIKGRAQVQMSFTSMVYSDGYVVPLSGSVNNLPGADNLTVSGADGAIRLESDNPRKIRAGWRDGNSGAMHGTFLGLIFGGGLTAMRAGGGAGAAAGLAWAIFGRGSDLKLTSGTRIQMAIPRPVPLEASRLPGYTRPDLTVADASTPRR
jgi:type IV secretion system protein VirB10